ncbi:DMT family transporter [Paralimibaculum aggregatum]|uniref:DMT family transporter n=1 Tax=Paralimibaculum aggregatum TaxID=3036245 RepID=A0ABQ6LDZ2_9RHOB|nr:DMT family transporter [Limibaculum sp. NKW23]GMG81572.1 DMT family transporter [Limibaculum sp. NKW23]
MPTDAARAVAGEPPVARYALMLTAAQMIFCAQDGVVKIVAGNLGVGQYATIRSGFVLFFIALAALAVRALRRPVKRTGPVVARSLFQVASILLYFTSITQLPLAVAGVGFYTFPIFTTLISAAVMRTPVSRATWAATFTGFAGAALIIGPGLAELDVLVLLPLLAATCYAVSVVITHYGCGQEDTLALVRVQNLCFLAVGLAGLGLGAAGMLPGGWSWSPVTGGTWAALAAISALNLLMAFVLLYVYQRAAPPRLAPFSYTYLVFAAAMDWIVWANPPTLQTLAGGALTALGGIMVLRAGRTPRQRFNQPLR